MANGDDKNWMRVCMAVDGSDGDGDAEVETRTYSFFGDAVLSTTD